MNYIKPIFTTLTLIIGIISLETKAAELKIFGCFPEEIKLQNGDTLKGFTAEYDIAVVDSGKMEELKKKYAGFKPSTGNLWFKKSRKCT